MKQATTKFLYFFLFFSGCFIAHAQYTETINSNRPGNSQGAFSVGTGVLQVEAGGYTGNDEHSLLGTNTDILGADYALRYGLFFEAFEVNLTGSYQGETTTIRMGGSDVDFKRSNFKTNTLGLKYMIYDPFRSLEPDKPNLYSWKANHRFKWKTLIPTVALYAGANFSFGDNPYLYEGESKFSPKLALITQHNWRGSWVLVMNLIIDKISEDFPSYSGIITLTHAFTPKFAGFLEYHGIISDIYADDLARTGVAYLVGDDLQFDISGLINFKDTPSRWQVAAGFSYRFDMHKNDEFIDDSFEGDRRKGRSKKREIETKPELEN